MKSMVILLDEKRLPSNARSDGGKPLILQDERQSCPMIENQRRDVPASARGLAARAMGEGEGTGMFGKVDQAEARGTGGAAGRRTVEKARAGARGTFPTRPPAPHTGGSVLTPIAFLAFAARQVVFLAQSFAAAKGSGGRIECTARLSASRRGRGRGSGKPLMWTPPSCGKAAAGWPA